MLFLAYLMLYSVLPGLRHDCRNFFGWRHGVLGTRSIKGFLGFILLALCMELSKLFLDWFGTLSSESQAWVWATCMLLELPLVALATSVVFVHEGHQSHKIFTFISHVCVLLALIDIWLLYMLLGNALSKLYDKFWNNEVK